MWCVQEFRVNTNLGESPLHPLFVVLLTEIADTEFQWPKCLQELPGVRTSETCFMFGSHFV